MKYVITAIVLLAVGYFVSKSDTFKGNTNTMSANPVVIIMTNKGDIELELFADKTPITVGNFIKLAESNFYDNTLFHRVIKDFMIQGGDPNTVAGESYTFGTGGPGYAILDEFVQGLSNVKGTISMANSGKNTGGSQFFINVVDNTYLDGKHTVFGRVLKGFDVAYKISEMPTNENKLPLDPVRVDRVVIK
ncbi:MAG TPA: peptidylprolyl isomerase [Candidatus Paceibacterota bacterium]